MTTEMINSSEVPIPSTQTSVYEAIFGRRMSKEFTDADVPREALERMFDAAVWAPNHRLTEPWRFFVLEKDSPARERIADLVWKFAYDNVASPNETIKEHVADNNRSRIADAPALVYAYSVPGPNEETTHENYASVCCAIHNMALAAVAEGTISGLEHRHRNEASKAGGDAGRGRRLGDGWRAVHWRACGRTRIQAQRSAERSLVAEVGF